MNDSNLSIGPTEHLRSDLQHVFYAEAFGFVFGASIGLPRSFTPLSRAGLPRRGHRLFGNVFSFGKLFGVAMLVGFGEKRCRKTFRCTHLGYQ